MADYKLKFRQKIKILVKIEISTKTQNLVKK